MIVSCCWAQGEKCRVEGREKGRKLGEKCGVERRGKGKEK